MALVMSFLSIPVPSLGDCSMTLRWDHSPPYFMAEDNQVVGIDADIVREVMLRLGCNLSFVQLPWARALLELRAGRVDIVSGAYHTPGREQYALYSSVVDLISPNLLFIRRSELDAFHYSDLEELLGSSFRLGAQINVHYSDEYDALIQAPRYADNIEYASQRKSLWRMLELSRVDGVIADKLTGFHEIQEMGLSTLATASPIVVSNDPAFFIFSRKTVTREFVEKFDHTLQAIIDDGTTGAILNRYTCPPVLTESPVLQTPASCP